MVPGVATTRCPVCLRGGDRRTAAPAHGVTRPWHRYFADVDVFVCPSNITLAFPHDHRPFDQRTITTPEGEWPYVNQSFWIAHAALAGLPAMVAPIGHTTGGLPIGAQVVGPLYEDGTALTFAELLADVIGGYELPPMNQP